MYCAVSPTGAASIHVFRMKPSDAVLSPSRLEWLDLYRGAAVLAMIETHVVNTFLAAPLRGGACFARMNYANGLVAPAFLFIAGLALGLGMRRASGPSRGWGRKVRRLAGVWLLGYALHFPSAQLFAGHWEEAVRVGTQVDVLQCLAVSLALLLACERWARRWVDALAAGLLVLAVFGAASAQAWRFAPVGLLTYFNHSTGSLFPLLPWLGFVCAGFLVSAAAVRERPGWTVLAYAPWIAGAAALAWLLPGLPGFFFQRLAWIVAFVPAFVFLARKVCPRWLAFAGRESLILYAAHLLLIEALAGMGVARAAHGFAGCVAIYAAVLGLSVAVAAGWSRWQRSRG